MKRIRLLVILSFIMGCLLMFACCGKASLDAPKDFRVDEASLVLTWNKVKGAKGYKAGKQQHSHSVDQVKIHGRFLIIAISHYYHRKDKQEGKAVRDHIGKMKTVPEVIQNTEIHRKEQKYKQQKGTELFP